MMQSIPPYLKELKYNKRNQFPHNRLQIFNDKPKDTLGKSLLKYFRDYCVKSSVHCIHYLADKNLYLYQRISWGLIFLVATISTAYVYMELTNIFYARRSLTTVDDSLYPATSVEFPAVAICPPSPFNINSNKLKLAREQFLPENSSNDSEKSFNNFFKNVIRMRLDNLTFLSPLFDAKDNWNYLQINPNLLTDVNIVQVLEFLSPKCNEIFVDACMWRHKHYNCCDLFKIEPTELGFCLVFNSFTTTLVEPGIQPKHTYNELSGHRHGLHANLILNNTEIGDLSLTVIIKHAVMMTGQNYDVPTNTITKISLTPEVTEAEQNMRPLSLDLRRCLFTDEIHEPLYKTIYGLPYNKRNCMARCFQSAIVQKCHCNLNAFFRNHPADNVEKCTVSDYKCIYANRIYFDNLRAITELLEPNCSCMTNCRRVLYKANVESLNILNPDPNYSGMSSIHLAVSYNHDYMVKYVTNIRFTFVELLASYGGIIGLFLGSSVLTVIEFVYVFTIGLHGHIKQYKNLHRPTKTTSKDLGQRKSNKIIVKPKF